ncbi:hypothetical protein GL213_13070 [Halogeometricum borinquense]|uniref:Uncharacterized protein n=2 Tax=Halogeometricum borinquense TaxID=60847 RepID=E4NT92_HALBP|nr:hypothetical protein [Halogeometricum borinquense]ADQ68189.1 hypothetical protein Hbor_26370 [Halogeometricum borinquense DSM 11551]ELY24767.1 hypothetical protein C499_15255 [Halogeometricum borinquense DSM 11551]QIB73227.1 hypothetical protein G3I44_02375 [Halogeometricum borinquense]QIQ77377.1 hypothetical protein GL213_13070 [Halogeometricum borinquense]RYJ12913.1 hypothetical protein ELS19_02300 [Halogeometricum borinquense]
MVDGIELPEELLRAKVKGERAGADVAGMQYIGYEIGLTKNSLHVYGKHCNADIADEDFRYMIVPLESIRAIKMADMKDRGRTIEIHLGEEDDITLHSEGQKSLGKNLRRLFLLVSRLLA